MTRPHISLVPLIAIAWGAPFGCSSGPEPKQAKAGSSFVVEPPTPPEMPAAPRRPPLVCNYVASTSGECFETVEAACAAMGCPKDKCVTPYGSAPSGPLRLTCD
jgi:hypothetical protein